MFLLCLPRSGSTILSLVLGNHSAILCPPEPWFLLKLAAVTLPGNINSAFDDERATGATKHFLRGDTVIQAARAFATTAYNQHLIAADKATFLDKTPRYYHILPFLDALFPKARKIWLKRNLLDVAVSYIRTWNIGTDIITGQQLTTHSFDFLLAPFSLAAYFDEASSLKLEVQYEELVRSPADTVVEICRFLNVQPEEAMFDFTRNEAMLSEYRASVVGDRLAPTTSTLHVQSVGRWVKELPLPEVEQILGLLGFDIFRRMGYGDTVDALQSLGISVPSENAAAESRLRIASATMDRTATLYDELAMLRVRLRHQREIREAVGRLLANVNPLRIIRRLVR